MEHLYDSGVVDKPIVTEKCTYKLTPSNKTFTAEATRSGREAARKEACNRAGLRCNAEKGFLKKCLETSESYSRGTALYEEEPAGDEEDSGDSSYGDTEEDPEPENPRTRNYPGGSVTFIPGGTVRASCRYKLSGKGTFLGMATGNSMSSAHNKACREAERKCRKKKGWFRKCREIPLY